MKAKEIISALDVSSKKQNKHEGQLTLSHGTVPYSPIPTKMPASHEKWDQIAELLPSLIGNFNERKILSNMPILDATESAFDDHYLVRASVILSSFAHAYYYNENSVPVAERQTKDPLPLCIEKPWQEVTSRLRPILPAPGRTVYDSVLCNWKYRGAASPTFSDIKLDDLDLLVPIVGNNEERIFFLTILLMEMKFAPALSEMITAQECVKTGDKDKLYQTLDSIIKVLREVTSTLNLISQNSNKQSYVDPVVWTKSVIKLEESIRPGEISGSGASLPLFHIMDAFINRKFSSELGKQLVKFKNILPESHRNFIDALGNTADSVVDYIIKNGDYSLRKKCDELLQTYENLLMAHLVKAFGYIYLSFNIGRKRTHGGNDESNQIAQMLKASITERRKALDVALTTATVISNKNIGGDAHELILDVPKTVIAFNPGEKCAIYPENLPEQISAMLNMLHCSGQESVKITPKWREYINKVTGVNHSDIQLTELLRHADLEHLEQMTVNELTQKTVSLNIEDDNYIGKYFNPLAPRLYSVSPIPNNTDQTQQLRLTVKKIQHIQSSVATSGVASTFLCASGVGAKIKIDKATTLPFSLPENPDTPIIMFAGGTGIAPFIGFIDERAKSSNKNNNWLFFSTTNRTQLYYQQHLEALMNTGHLNYHAIFSREKTAISTDPVNMTLKFTPDSEGNSTGYMAKLIQNQGKELADLIINKKAHIYVCGHANFAQNVQEGLRSILLPYYRYNKSKTDRMINNLMSNGIYHHDIFTRDITTPKKCYSIADVAQHNGKDLWVVINNKVYDLSTFAGQHPGGEKIFRAIAGKYADKSYQVINHHLNQQINSQLEGMQIGEIASVELPPKIQSLQVSWVNVLHDIVTLENILQFGFGVENEHQKIYLHNSVFDAYITRYIQSAISEGLHKLYLSLGTDNKISLDQLLNLPESRRLLQLPAYIKNISKSITAESKNAKFKNLLLVNICTNLVELSRKIINAQKNLIVQGIHAIEQQKNSVDLNKLAKLLREYENLFTQYTLEVDRLFLELFTLKNAENISEIKNVAAQESIVIVGGGLTGIVLSAFLAKQGLKVTVYDALPDPRLVHLSEKRSINITLCERGLSPLSAIGAYNAVLAECVPAKSRMIHGSDNTLTKQFYGNDGEALYSIGRHTLAKTLLAYVADNYDVTFKFNEKCLFTNPDTKSLVFLNKDTQNITTTSASLIFGADGAASSIRKTLQKYTPHYKIEKSKHFHAYKEIMLKNPPREIALQMNYLHIWPRDNFMLIGFPNTDGSMTLSLHIPEHGNGISLDNVKTPEEYHRLFQDNFNDVYPSIKQELTESFYNPTGHIVSMKCFPWIYQDKIALIGDAAHTLFPYYGQGANCAFEDCKILSDCYLETPNDWATILEKFQSLRKPNSDTIIDLAAQHMNILSTKVGERDFQLAEKISLALQKIAPEFRKLYHNISFTTIPYREALLREHTFQAVIRSLMSVANIEDKINSSEWQTLCHTTIKSIVNQDRVSTHNAAIMHGSISTQNTSARQSLFKRPWATVGHSSAGTLFFSKQPKSPKNIQGDQQTQNHTLFKSFEL